ncbi:MAG: ATP synthase F1 subunit gamma, partial [Pseudomonadota bacterium]|nr:ATP synthase F1 subunit gamma [Pseudomonadota bacterium]
MPNLKEIRTKTKSIKNTQKITKAMQMVAASKMRKAQERMEATKPYAHKFRLLVSHLANANAEYEHPYMIGRDSIKRVGIIVVSSDRGLCGGLNINLFKRAIKLSKSYEDQSVEVDYCLLGKKAVSFFNSIGGNVIAVKTDLGENPDIDDLLGSVKVMLDAYNEGKIDKLYVISNEFVSTMRQVPEALQLLPILKDESEEYSHHWDYIYEPSPEAILEEILVRYIESQVYQA